MCAQHPRTIPPLRAFTDGAPLTFRRTPGTIHEPRHSCTARDRSATFRHRRPRREDHQRASQESPILTLTRNPTPNPARTLTLTLAFTLTQTLTPTLTLALTLPLPLPLTLTL